MKWVYCDNKIVSKPVTKVSFQDEGFLYGQGLFETMRCYNGRVFCLKEHLRRLIKGCPLLGMRPPAFKKLEKAIFSVIKANHLKDAYIRLNVYKGISKVRLLVFAKKLLSPSDTKYKRGFSVVLFKDERIGDSALNKVKSLNHYFYNRLSSLAKAGGFDEALFLNSSMEVVEGSRTNLFLVKGLRVLTPQISCGCLPGITRAAVIKILKKIKVPVIEAKIFPEKLFSCDEMFVTNSLIGVMPVSRLDRRPMGKGAPGELTRKIMQAYQERVEKECLLR